jgi:hypothetical protein
VFKCRDEPSEESEKKKKKKKPHHFFLYRLGHPTTWSKGKMENPLKTLFFFFFTLPFLLLVIDSHRPEEHRTPEWEGGGTRGGNEKREKLKAENHIQFTFFFNSFFEFLLISTR